MILLRYGPDSMSDGSADKVNGPLLMSIVGDEFLACDIDDDDNDDVSHRTSLCRQL